MQVVSHPRKPEESKERGGPGYRWDTGAAECIPQALQAHPGLEKPQGLPGFVHYEEAVFLFAQWTPVGLSRVKDKDRNVLGLEGSPESELVSSAYIREDSGGRPELLPAWPLFSMFSWTIVFLHSPPVVLPAREKLAFGKGEPEGAVFFFPGECQRLP